MANTFRLATKSNVGVTTVGIYTAPTSTTSTIIGITLANVSGSGINVTVGIARSVGVGDNVSILKNVPIPQGSTLEVMQGNKIVLEDSDSLTAKSDVNDSLDCAITILEMT
jgi:hypothetical protein